MIRDEITFFTETNKKQDSTLSIWWDTLKAYLRGRIISYASFKKKSTNEYTAKLESELKELKTSYSQSSDRSTLNKIINTKYELNKIYHKRAEYALFRIKQSYWEMGEKTGRLLTYRLKQQNCSKCIASIPMANIAVTASLR